MVRSQTLWSSPRMCEGEGHTELPRELCSLQLCRAVLVPRFCHWGLQSPITHSWQDVQCVCSWGLMGAGGSGGGCRA